MQERLESIFQECEEVKRKVVSCDELRRDRDERISVLRKEIDELTLSYEDIEQKNA